MNNRDLNLEEKKSEKIVDVLHNFSIDRQAPPDFLGQVMSKVDKLKPTRFALLVRWCRSFTGGVFSTQVACAVILLVALIGAIPQYARWFTGSSTKNPIDFSDISPDSEDFASVQDDLWDNNLGCKLKDGMRKALLVARTSNAKAEVWRCPSGDFLVELEIESDETATTQWISGKAITARAASNPGSIILASTISGGGKALSKAFDFSLVTPVFAAADSPKVGSGQTAQGQKVICQKRVRKGEVKRRIRTSEKTCRDETINTATGNVIESKDAKCDCSDF